MGEIETPVVREMLKELSVECPDMYPLIQQWMRAPTCLRLIHFLSSWFHSWLTCPDLAWWIGDDENQVRYALHSLLKQGFVVKLEIPEAQLTFYRLANQESERMTCFHKWFQRCRAQLGDASRLLGLSWHRPDL